MKFLRTLLSWRRDFRYQNWVILDNQKQHLERTSLSRFTKRSWNVVTEPWKSRFNVFEVSIRTWSWPQCIVCENRVGQRFFQTLQVSFKFWSKPRRKHRTFWLIFTFCRKFCFLSKTKFTFSKCKNESDTSNLVENFNFL